MRYWVQLATEQFPPSALVRQAVEAEQAGVGAQPSMPVAECGAPTGLDSGEPRWRR